MKVLLKEDVDNLGYKGEVMDVADGYGRNYLIPRGLAVKATSGALNEARAWRERAAARMAELQREHESLSARISETILNFTARAGETGKLYGSITTADVVDQLNETLGTEIDRRTLAGQPLRQLGDHMVTVRLSRDYAPQLRVVIHPFEEEEVASEGEDAEVADAAEETEAPAAAEEAAGEIASEEVEEETEESEAATEDDVGAE